MPSPLQTLPVWGEALGSPSSWAPQHPPGLSAGGFPMRNEVPALTETLPAPETLAGPPSHVDWAMFNEDRALDEALPAAQAFLWSLP